MVHAKFSKIILFIALLFVGCGEHRRVYDDNFKEGYPSSPTISLSELEKADEVVASISDGDTIKLTLDGRLTTIRLTGIDSFETRKNNKAYRQAYEHNITVEEVVFRGKLAKSYIKTVLANKKDFYLEYDETIKDRYDRILSYVWFSDKEMLNMKIICDGYALPLSIKPNTKYAEDFTRCYEYAKKHHLGVWNDTN